MLPNVPSPHPPPPWGRIARLKTGHAVSMHSLGYFYCKRKNYLFVYLKFTFTQESCIFTAVTGNRPGRQNHPELRANGVSCGRSPSGHEAARCNGSAAFHSADVPRRKPSLPLPRATLLAVHQEVFCCE